MREWIETTQDAGPGLAELSIYFMDLTDLLDHIERSATHYQTLRVERRATTEDVKAAYKNVLRRHPARYKLDLAEPERLRVGAAFEKAALAFTVLSNYGRRTEYDNSLVPSTVELSRSDATFLKAAHIAAPAASQAPERPGDAGMAMDPLPSPLSDQAQGENRRRVTRLGVALPVRVTGVDRGEGKWQQMTHTVDVSRSGVALRLGRRLHVGNIVHLLVPLPVSLRSHGYDAPGYSVFAIVRRVERTEGATHVYGLEFFGEHPPPGWQKKPWGVFLTTQWADQCRRREDRVERAEPIGVTFLDAAARRVGEALGVTENVSASGARIRLQTGAPDVDLIVAMGLREAFESRAVVRGRYTGPDGSERLCVQFIDRPFPV